MAFDKSTLGTRYTCFECEAKFYDLNKDPICPSCGADQRESTNPDAREAFLASLSTRGRKKQKKEEVIEEIKAPEEDPNADDAVDPDLSEDEEEEDMGLSADDLLSADAADEEEEA